MRRSDQLSSAKRIVEQTQSRGTMRCPFCGYAEVVVAT